MSILVSSDTHIIVQRITGREVEGLRDTVAKKVRIPP